MAVNAEKHVPSVTREGYVLPVFTVHGFVVPRCTYCMSTKCEHTCTARIPTKYTKLRKSQSFQVKRQASSPRALKYSQSFQSDTRPNVSASRRKVNQWIYDDVETSENESFLSLDISKTDTSLDVSLSSSFTEDVKPEVLPSHVAVWCHNHKFTMGESHGSDTTSTTGFESDMSENTFRLSDTSDDAKKMKTSDLENGSCLGDDVLQRTDQSEIELECAQCNLSLSVPEPTCSIENISTAISHCTLSTNYEQGISTPESLLLGSEDLEPPSDEASGLIRGDLIPNGTYRTEHEDTHGHVLDTYEEYPLTSSNSCLHQEPEKEHNISSYYEHNSLEYSSQSAWLFNDGSSDMAVFGTGKSLADTLNTVDFSLNGLSTIELIPNGLETDFVQRSIDSDLSPPTGLESNLTNNETEHEFCVPPDDTCRVPSMTTNENSTSVEQTNTDNCDFETISTKVPVITSTPRLNMPADVHGDTSDTTSIDSESMYNRLKLKYIPAGNEHMEPACHDTSRDTLSECDSSFHEGDQNISKEFITSLDFVDMEPNKDVIGAAEQTADMMCSTEPSFSVASLTKPSNDTIGSPEQIKDVVDSALPKHDMVGPTESTNAMTGPTESINDMTGPTESTNDMIGPTESTTNMIDPTESTNDMIGPTESTKYLAGSTQPTKDMSDSTEPTKDMIGSAKLSKDMVDPSEPNTSIASSAESTKDILESTVNASEANDSVPTRMEEEMSLSESTNIDEVFLSLLYEDDGESVRPENVSSVDIDINISNVMETPEINKSSVCEKESDECMEHMTNIEDTLVSNEGTMDKESNAPVARASAEKDNIDNINEQNTENVNTFLDGLTSNTDNLFDDSNAQILDNIVHGVKIHEDPESPENAIRPDTERNTEVPDIGSVIHTDVNEQGIAVREKVVDSANTLRNVDDEDSIHTDDSRTPSYSMDFESDSDSFDNDYNETPLSEGTLEIVHDESFGDTSERFKFEEQTENKEMGAKVQRIALITEKEDTLRTFAKNLAIEIISEAVTCVYWQQKENVLCAETVEHSVVQENCDDYMDDDSKVKKNSSSLNSNNEIKYCADQIGIIDAKEILPLKNTAYTKTSSNPDLKFHFRSASRRNSYCKDTTTNASRKPLVRSKSELSLRQSSVLNSDKTDTHGSNLSSPASISTFEIFSGEKSAAFVISIDDPESSPEQKAAGPRPLSSSF